MNLRIFIALILVLGFAPSTKAAETETLFELHQFQKAGGPKLPYRLLRPLNYKADGSVKYPLVLFLHGAGERGDDNFVTLVHGVKQFAKPEIRAKYPCFVVVPQCPLGKRWVEVDWGLDSHQQLPEDSDTIKLVLDLIASIQKSEKIDDKRIYATGLSMGGFGVWDLITRHPDLFAAAAPVCGGGDETVASKVAKLPIWTFHGDGDTVVKPDRTRNMVNAVVKAGGRPIYTEYIGVGHDSWTKAYADAKLIEWMFAQHK